MLSCHPHLPSSTLRFQTTPQGLMKNVVDGGEEGAAIFESCSIRPPVGLKHTSAAESRCSLPQTVGSRLNTKVAHKEDGLAFDWMRAVAASLVSLDLLVGLLLAVFLDATYSILVSTPSHCWALYRNWTPLPPTGCNSHMSHLFQDRSLYVGPEMNGISVASPPGSVKHPEWPAFCQSSRQFEAKRTTAKPQSPALEIPWPSWYTEFPQAWIRLEQGGAKAAFYCGEAKRMDVERQTKALRSAALCFTSPFGFVVVPFLKFFPLTVFRNFYAAAHEYLEGRPEKVVGAGIKEGCMEDRSSSSASWSKDVVLEATQIHSEWQPVQWPFKTSLLAEVLQPMPLPAHGLCGQNDSDCLLKVQAQGKALCTQGSPTPCTFRRFAHFPGSGTSEGPQRAAIRPIQIHFLRCTIRHGQVAWFSSERTRPVRGDGVPFVALLQRGVELGQPLKAMKLAAAASCKGLAWGVKSASRTRTGRQNLGKTFPLSLHRLLTGSLLKPSGYAALPVSAAALSSEISCPPARNKTDLSKPFKATRSNQVQLQATTDKTRRHYLRVRRFRRRMFLVDDPSCGETSKTGSFNAGMELFFHDNTLCVFLLPCEAQCMRNKDLRRFFGVRPSAGVDWDSAGTFGIWMLSVVFVSAVGLCVDVDIDAQTVRPLRVTVTADGGYTLRMRAGMEGETQFRFFVEFGGAVTALKTRDA
ncbi:hypothetical protein DFH08DRAFT_802797 [Mycena albidolilacea]|uniref:Uncharacterized protein n=1 Tax=Mycena albidolilacea TaxID=1033008 RepID=A0AAD7EYE3_9AGAR|nr:hypothetical protein DFH08DRAFT_802797 [Mycena albidolilacea]